MYLTTNAAVDAQVEITLHAPRRPDEEAISVVLGDERVKLDFYDAESLDRLRDIAEEGARRLRAVIDANAQAASH
jgi:hypothetical protein